jgi:uncharacterized membrane protein
MALAFGWASPALAQDEGPADTLSISTSYPSMVIGIGETVTFNLDIRSPVPQTVDLEVADLPQDWTAEFRGDGRIIHSVFVGNEPAQVELRVTPPDSVSGGMYALTAVARGASGRSEFPIELSVKDKVPAQLALETDFPILRGGSESPFNFATTLKNDGDEDITVNLLAEAPKELAVTFKAAGKDITNLPTDIKSGDEQRIDITAEPLTALPVGTYPITVLAQGENSETTLTLTAEVTGQPQLTITTPDERLSGDAYLGRSTPIKLILRNSGNSPASGVTLSASSPAGWTVTLDPEQVVEVPAEGEVEVTANVRPAEKAVAGDYMLTFRAEPNEGAAKSADFRVTVRTSTLWGVVGIALIAVAVAIVGLAVVRFGRR